MIAPGAIVHVNRRGNVAWVVAGKNTDGRWHCICKAVDHKSREVFSRLLVGEGDMVLVREAPSFQPGDSILLDGLAHTVVADNGGSVTLEVPAQRFCTRGGDYLHQAAGNHITLPKSDLILEQLETLP